MTQELNPMRTSVPDSTDKVKAVDLALPPKTEEGHPVATINEVVINPEAVVTLFLEEASEGGGVVLVVVVSVTKGPCKLSSLLRSLSMRSLTSKKKTKNSKRCSPS